MTTFASTTRPLDPAAERDYDRFGRVLLLPGLATTHVDGAPTGTEHPMTPVWDRRGHLVYACAPPCEVHARLASAVDRSAWFAYCVATGTRPDVVADPRHQRALLIKHLTHAYVSTESGTAPVTALGWATFPPVNLTYAKT